MTFPSISLVGQDFKSDILESITARRLFHSILSEILCGSSHGGIDADEVNHGALVQFLQNQKNSSNAARHAAAFARQKSLSFPGLLKKGDADKATLGSKVEVLLAHDDGSASDAAMEVTSDPHAYAFFKWVYVLNRIDSTHMINRIKNMKVEPAENTMLKVLLSKQLCGAF
jgi:hypothetical protein